MPPLKSAATALNSAIRPTTFIQSARLNTHTGLNITLASETFQVTGSFKFRAAYNVAANVPNQRIITASSGNFGQALAYACSLLGKKCTVVMPDNSAKVKVDAVREFGGVVDLVQTASKSRAQRVSELAAEDPSAYVASAYDDPLVIEGNSTLGVELAELADPFDAVLVPVGGGGLSAGIINGLRSHGNTRTSVFGVEPELANDCARSFRGKAIEANSSEPQTIADGARTVSVGKHNWEVLQSGLADVIEVAEETIVDAMQKLFLYANVKAEPTGAVGLAGALTRSEQFRGQRICCVVSGGNVDPAVFQRLVFGD